MWTFLVVVVPVVTSLTATKQFVEEPRDVEIVVGSRVILPCLTRPLDESQVTWCKNDFCTLGKTRDLPSYPRYQIIGDPNKGEHHFEIVNASLQDVGMYQCQIRAGPRRPGAMSRKAKVTVLQGPSRLSLDSPIILVEDIQSFVVCRAIDAFPEAKLSWHLPPPLAYVAKSDYVQIRSEWERNSVSNISVVARRSWHGQFVECEAHSVALSALNTSVRTREMIVTHFLPELNLNVINLQLENTLIGIECDVVARPEVNRRRWWHGTRLLNVDDSVHLSLWITRSMHKSVVTCQATNSIGTRNVSLILDVIYKPMFIDDEGLEIKDRSVILVDEGDPMTLNCQVDSSPPCSFSWSFNGRDLDVHVDSLHITRINSTKDLGVYTCIAFHSTFGKFNRTIRVSLKGPPEMKDEIKIESVEAGQKAMLICSVLEQESVEFSWAHKNESPLKSGGRYIIEEKKKGDWIESRLAISEVSMSDGGFYVCIAQNQYGFSKHRSELRVFNLTSLFVERSLLYGSLLIGVLVTILLLILIVICRHRRTRQRSSTTDETISSLQKQTQSCEVHRSENEDDETTSTVAQWLFNNNQSFSPLTEIHDKDKYSGLFHSARDDSFDVSNPLRRCSTVV